MYTTSARNRLNCLLYVHRNQTVKTVEHTAYTTIHYPYCMRKQQQNSSGYNKLSTTRFYFDSLCLTLSYAVCARASRQFNYERERISVFSLSIRHMYYRSVRLVCGLSFDDLNKKKRSHGSDDRVLKKFCTEINVKKVVWPIHSKSVNTLQKKYKKNKSFC